MIANCPRCKKDFLTEADMHIITPVKNYEASCLCIFRDAVAKQKEEIERLIADLKFAMSFSPKQENLTEGMVPMFYHSLSYEGDLKINQRLDEIRSKYFSEKEKSDEC